MWLDAGFELGNHTFGHTSLNRTSLKEFEDSVIQGEAVTKLLLAQHNKQLRYFRHPYLHTGRDLQTRREAEAFLVARGYRIAPVTMDGWDWNSSGWLGPPAPASRCATPPTTSWPTWPPAAASRRSSACTTSSVAR